MRNLFFVLSLILFSGSVWAQQSRTEIKNDISLAASNYKAYVGPTKKLSKSPAGYKPFYISHYGRHGSRFLINPADYDMPFQTLSRADSLGKLTPKGKEVLHKVTLMRNEVQGRLGELTPLGAEQHRQIAKRMMERFPEVFKGRTHIDAKSTIVIRCILSMENEMQQLISMNPQLQITHDASRHDMYYMNDEHSPYVKGARNEEAIKAFKKFYKDHAQFSHLMTVLFNDSNYVKYVIKPEELGAKLCSLACNIQSTELRKQFNMYDIFTFDELYNYWQIGNASWYSFYGPNKLNEGKGMYVQSNLLRNIIMEADSCIRLAHPGATMRFGHESDVMPLTCLLNVNVYGTPRTSLEQLDDENWLNYKIYPMGCNLQFIFYRSSKAGEPILFKLLLNEDEATLPDLQPVSGPYYKWSDFREFFLKKLQEAPKL
ncbi:MAG: histidine-type phosphatase [Prevotella sp.]|jgi:hypothetical protein